MMNSETESLVTKTLEPKQKRSKINDKSISDMVDEKVLAKGKLDAEREDTWEREKEKLKLLKEEKEKNTKAEYIAEKNRLKIASKKKRDQQSDSKRTEKGKSYEKTLPQSVQQIVGNNYELDKMPGNGACGISSFAKHAFDDESLGPEIGRELNSEIAEHFWYYKQLLEFPYERPVGGAESVRFEEHQERELLDFLRNHPRNGYVWRGFMDMQALSNKYGMPIKIVSIKDNNDPKPKVERLEPDGDFEVKQKVAEMILLNTGQYHFDLISKKKTDSEEEYNLVLETTTTSQEQSKHKEHEKTNTTENDIEIEQKGGVKSSKEDISELRIMIEHMKKEINKLKEHKCPNVNETVTVKNANKSFKTIGTLDPKKPNSHNDQEVIRQNSERNEDKKNKEKPKPHKCQKCETYFQSMSILESHMKEKHERTYECNSCYFQSNSVHTLEQHKKEKHIVNYNCKKCDKPFLNEDILRNTLKCMTENPEWRSLTVKLVISRTQQGRP